MTARDDGAARVGGGGPVQLTTVGDLQDGQRVGFIMPDNSTRWETLRKVWRYDDGSVTLEFEGEDPGMWNFNDEYLSVPVRVKQ